MKKLLCAALTVLMCAGLLACSNGKIEDKVSENDNSAIHESDKVLSEKEGEEAQPEEENTDEGENAAEQVQSPLAGTYWYATGHYKYSEDKELISWEAFDSTLRFADLYFDYDGTALFRDIEDNRYIYTKHYTWTDDGEKIHLVNLDKDDWGEEFFASLEDGVLRFEAFESILHMESGERPYFGSEYCMADLYGVWKLTSIADDSGIVPAADKGLYSTMEFKTDTTEESGYGMYAWFTYEEDYEVVESIEQALVMELEYKDLRFANEDGSKRYEVSFMDDNTVTVTSYDYTATDYTRTQSMIYKRRNEKQQFEDRAERIEGKYEKQMSALEDISEKEICVFDEFLEWDTLLSDIMSYHKKHMTRDNYEPLQLEQMSWSLNRQNSMNKTQKMLAGTSGARVEKYLHGNKLAKERTLELIALIK